MTRPKLMTVAAMAAGAALVPFAATAQTLTTLYSFSKAHGGNPSALISQGHDLYGTTFQGGTSNKGTVFKFDLNTGKEKVLYSFAGGADGAYPHTALLYQNGLLYGTTGIGGGGACSTGCGTVFSVNPATGAKVTLYRFAGGNDGQTPEAPLISVGGLLYSTTAAGGGSASTSAVYSVDPTTGTETVLYGFAGGTDGGTPLSELLPLGGLLYGTTSTGGASNYGTVFSINMATNAESIVYSFAGGTDGRAPMTGLIYDGTTLYGTTYYGGKGCRRIGCGTLYSVDPGTETETVLLQFAGGTHGQNPNSIILHGSSLYGTTEFGGLGVGTIFSTRLTKFTGKTLYSFTDGSNGSFPSGKLLYEHGVYYGTTANGGSANLGTLFMLTP
jgi:uncharacterized repeat protein (TIGR03803 family)